MIEKVISGGQTGVDQAALLAAKNVGIPTGGWMPKGYNTHDGGRPDFAALYGVREHLSYKYAPRTHDNVRDSDGTLQIAAFLNSAGEICTSKAINSLNKANLVVPLYRSSGLYNQIYESRYEAVFVASWINSADIRILNVAGNSERTAPGIFDFTVKYLMDVFTRLKKKFEENK